MEAETNYLVIDVETTIRNWKKGQGANPFDPRNKLCVVGLLTQDGSEILKIEYDSEPFGEQLQRLQKLIDAVDVLVLFNAKFDLHWLRRYGIKFQHKRIWDVQVAHFVIVGQSEKLPSLNSVSAYNGLGQKHDYIWENYWSKKIDTDEIPLPELNTYLEQDLLLTRDNYLKQVEYLRDKPERERVVRLDCVDTLILEEMEWNGLIYDVEESKRRAIGIHEELARLDGELASILEFDDLNWSSDNQISVALYGGTLERVKKVQDGVFKTGKRIGQPKYRNEVYRISFPRLVEPHEGSELAKTGVDGETLWSASEPTLLELHARGKAGKLIGLILKRSELEKLCGTYYEGLPTLIGSMGWEGNTIHGTLNQCVAATGRLSSSKPNLQNTDKIVEKLFRSRYDN